MKSESSQHGEPSLGTSTLHATGVAAAVGVGVSVPVAVGVGVAVSAGVAVAVAVGVAVGVGVAVAVGVDVTVGVALSVGVGVGDSVGVAVGVGVGVLVAVAVAVGVSVGVGVAVSVGVGVGVVVGVGVGVAVGVPLHSTGYGANAGTATRSTQSTLNSVTQLTHPTRSASVVTLPPHAAPPGTATFGQVPAKPMSAGSMSSPPPLPPILDPAPKVRPLATVTSSSHSRSRPPHALHTFFARRLSALSMTPRVLASADGHGGDAAPLPTAIQQRASARVLTSANLTALRPIARWQLFRIRSRTRSLASSCP